MKNKLGKELQHELRSVHMSEDLKERVLEAVEKERFRQERRRSPLVMLATAAAVMLAICLSVGVITANTHRGMPRDNVYAQGSGDWVWTGTADMLYHFQKSCAGGDGAQRVRLSEAKAEGRTACAQCIRISENASEGVGSATPEPARSGEAFVMANATPEPAAQSVVAQENAFNAASDAFDAATPEPVPAAEEFTMALTTPEPTSLPTPAPINAQSGVIAEETVWLTDDGVFYHSVENCSGMKNAELVGVSEAEAMGKQACPTCIPQQVQSGNEWNEMLENAGVYLETAYAEGYLSIRTEPVAVWEWIEPDEPVEVTFNSESWQRLVDLIELESGRFTQEQLDKIQAGECTGLRTVHYEVLAWMLYDDSGNEVPMERSWQFKEMQDGDVVITDLLDVGSGVPAVAEAYVSTHVSEYVMDTDGILSIDSRNELSAQRAVIEPQGEGYYVSMELRESDENNMTPIVGLSIDEAEGTVAASTFEDADLSIERVVLDGESYVLIGFDGVENPDVRQLEIVSTLEVADGALPLKLIFAQRCPANTVAVKVSRNFVEAELSEVPEEMREVMKAQRLAPEEMHVVFTSDGELVELYSDPVRISD